MFSKGELGIHSKKNTHKRYDFIENLLPYDLDGIYEAGLDRLLK
ncbi:hypothetical protein [Clostridium tepidiprofundi]|nr:hypothetical protein [Clostridium tepidiprofundi]